MSENELNKTNPNEKILNETNLNEDIIEELNDEELENVTGGVSKCIIRVSRAHKKSTSPVSDSSKNRI